MLNIVIFGPPGSGKGTQSARIAKKYDLRHLSTGDILREEMDKKTSLGKKVSEYIDKGLLVPDDIVLKMLYDYAAGHMDSPGFIFDGFPRTIVQAEALDKLLNKRGIPINIVLSVEVEEQELFKRIMGRGEDSGRSDDSEEIARQRLDVYKEQSMPLIDYYKQQGKIVTIDGMKPVDEVFDRICQAIEAVKAV